MFDYKGSTITIFSMVITATSPLDASTIRFAGRLISLPYPAYNQGSSKDQKLDENKYRVAKERRTQKKKSGDFKGK